jgi:hypothetical protein
MAAAAAERIQLAWGLNATGQASTRAEAGAESSAAWTRSSSPAGAGNVAINLNVASTEPGVYTETESGVNGFLGEGFI